MIDLTLRIKGKDRTFRASAITCRCSIDAWKLAKRWETESAKDEMSEELIDEAIDLIVRVYGNRFTRDEFLDGCIGSIFFIAPAIVRAIMMDVGDKLAAFPPKAAQSGTV